MRNIYKQLLLRNYLTYLNQKHTHIILLHSPPQNLVVDLKSKITTKTKSLSEIISHIKTNKSIKDSRVNCDVDGENKYHLVK